jgi:DNA-binding NtrC family response regulator
MRKILITDDDSFLMGLYRVALRKLDAEVVYAATLEEGRERLASERFDAVCFDVNLGERGEEGLELLALAHARTPGLPILMMSTQDDAATQGRCAEACSFLSKNGDFVPSLAATLHALVAQWAAAA